MTNSSKFGDKLAARIAYIKTPGHYKKTWLTALWTSILLYPLFAYFFLTIKSKRRKKKRKGQRGSVRGSQGEKNWVLPSTSDGNFSRGYPGVSRAIVDDEA